MRHSLFHSPRHLRQHITMEPPEPMRTKEPTRCLNAYNFFFKRERVRLLESLPENPDRDPRYVKHRSLCVTFVFGPIVCFCHLIIILFISFHTTGVSDMARWSLKNWVRLLGKTGETSRTRKGHIVKLLPMKTAYGTRRNSRNTRLRANTYVAQGDFMNWTSTKTSPKRHILQQRLLSRRLRP